MFAFLKIKWAILLNLMCLFVSGWAYSYTSIAVLPNGSPMTFNSDGTTRVSASVPLTWNPDSGPMQDGNSIHDFSNATYAQYQSYCSSGGGGGSGSCSMNPLLREAWAASPVSNQEGIDLINNAFNIWKNQSTDASLSYSQGSSLGEDVDVCNYSEYIDSALEVFAINGDENDPRVCGCLGTCSRPCTNPVVFDANGDIIALEAGEGNRYSVLGSAGPIVWPGANRFLKFEAIINGVCLDASPDEGCDGTTFNTAQITSVIVHELGHAQGMGHSQVNPNSIGFTGGSATAPSDSAYLTSDATWGVQGAVPTMYPFLVSGDDQSSLTMDDKIGMAHLYPAASFAAPGYCTLTGHVYQGVSGLRCVEVVFRNSSSQVINAVSVETGVETSNNGSSGACAEFYPNGECKIPYTPGYNLCTGTSDQCGSYSVKVPSPASGTQTYNIEVNAIPNFGPGSSIGTCPSNPSFSGVNQTAGWRITTNGSVTCNSSGAITAGGTNLNITLP